eukprot:255303-Prymnesium_polylepis.1
MPKKVRPPPLVEPGKGSIHGWSYSYNDQGICNVGTASSGPFKHFTIKLKAYDNYAADPEAAVLKALVERQKEAGPGAPADEIEYHQSLLAGEPPRQRRTQPTEELPPAPKEEVRQTVQPEHFMHSKHSERNDHDAQRLGSRHAKVRDVSYSEAAAKLEEMGLQAEAWLHEVRRIVVQMEIILDEIPPEHAAAAQALQLALIEMLDEGEDQDEGEEGDASERCEPCDTAQPDAPAESQRPTEAERVATAYFEEVAAAVEWSTEGTAPPSPPLAVLRASHNG